MSKYQTVFQSVSTILLSHQQWMWALVGLCSHQYLVLAVFVVIVGFLRFNHSNRCKVVSCDLQCAFPND